MAQETKVRCPVPLIGMGLFHVLILFSITWAKIVPILGISKKSILGTILGNEITTYFRALKDSVSAVDFGHSVLIKLYV